MNGAFYIGATGLAAQQRALEVISNNITNLNTPAYKRSQVRFSELVSPQQGEAASELEAGLAGVMSEQALREFSQGEIKPTGRPLDIAINGEGFIELMGPGGQTMLWRGGALHVNSDGYLAAANGMPLKALISAPLDAGAITISPDGQVRAASGASGAASTDLGRIELVRAKDATNLKVLGDGLYQAGSDADLIQAAPGEDGAGLITSGALEGSNVQLTDEMVTLMLLQRAYAASAQVVQAGDQLMAIANNLRR